MSAGRLRRRFPAEAESAALGAALQAAAVLQGVPVRQYVSDNPPPCEPEVRARLLRRCGQWMCYRANVSVCYKAGMRCG